MRFYIYPYRIVEVISLAFVNHPSENARHVGRFRVGQSPMTNCIPFASAAVLTLLVSLSTAAPPKAGLPNRPVPGRTNSVDAALNAGETAFRTILNEVDFLSSADGLEATVQIQEVRSALNVVYDVNADGVVDVHELSKASDADRTAFERISQRDFLNSFEVLRHIDADRNGILSDDELGSVFRDQLNLLADSLNIEIGDSPNIAELEDRIARVVPGVRKEAPRASEVSVPTAYEKQATNRKYAASLIGIYDEDANGLLTRNEWQRLSPEWRRGDRNSDGRLTTDELASELQRIVSLDSTPAESSRSDAPKLNPSVLRRLPDGLPAWFIEKDAAGNSDGQVQMSEFETEWSDEKVVQFQRLDRNDDGVVMPSEVLESSDSTQ